MKNSILSLAIATIALFSVNTAIAQNPKISNPDKATVRISGSYNTDAAGNVTYTVCVDNARCTGLGNASSVEAFLTVVGTADGTCSNHGQPDRTIPGQSFTTAGGKVTLTASNGVLIVSGVCATIGGQCKPNGFDWTSKVSNVKITDLFLTLNGSKVSLKDYISQLGL
jgi:hypothetical protein